LVEIGNDIVDMLDTDRQPHIAISHAGGLLLLGTELGVGDGGRVSGEALRGSPTLTGTLDRKPLINSFTR